MSISGASSEGIKEQASKLESMPKKNWGAIIYRKMSFLFTRIMGGDEAYNNKIVKDIANGKLLLQEFECI